MTGCRLAQEEVLLNKHTDKPVLRICIAIPISDKEIADYGYIL